MLNSLSAKLISPKTVLVLNAIIVVGAGLLLFRMPSPTSFGQVLFPFLAPALTIYSFILKPPSKVLSKVAAAVNVFVVLAGIGFIFISAAFAKQSIFNFWPVLIFFIFIPLVSALSLWHVSSQQSGR